MALTTRTWNHSVPESLYSGLEDLSTRLSSLYRNSLLGLTLYGAALEDGHSHSPAQTIMVLERVDIGPLRTLAQHASLFGSQNLAAPLAMTPEYITASLDTFPLELIEVHQRHVTLVGTDYFESLDIRDEHVRLQCEREFKRILMRIRHGILLAADHERQIGHLIADVGQHIIRTLRGMLWLRGAKDYRPRDAVVSQCAGALSRPLTGVTTAMRVGAACGWAELQSLYDDVEALAQWANDE